MEVEKSCIGLDLMAIVGEEEKREMAKEKEKKEERVRAPRSKQRPPSDHGEVRMPRRGAE